PTVVTSSGETSSEAGVVPPADEVRLPLTGRSHRPVALLSAGVVGATLVMVGICQKSPRDESFVEGVTPEASAAPAESSTALAEPPTVPAEPSTAAARSILAAGEPAEISQPAE